MKSYEERINESAEAEFEKAKNKGKSVTKWEIYAHIASTAQYGRKLDEAVYAYTKCIEIVGPNDLWHIRELARCYAERGEYKIAIRMFKKLINEHQESLHRALTKGFGYNIYCISSKVNLRGYESIDIHAIDNIYYLLAMCYDELENYDLAEKHYLKALKRDPRYDCTYKCLARIYQIQGRDDEAIELMKEALKYSAPKGYINKRDIKEHIKQIEDREIIKVRKKWFTRFQDIFLDVEAEPNQE